MHLAHRADRPGFHPLPNQPRLFVRVSLVSHLGRDLVLLGRLRQGPHFAQGAGQRFLHECVFAQFHRREAGRGVRVIRNRHRHRVDVLSFFVEHVAIVAKPLGLGVVLERVQCHAPVDVTQGVDVLARDTVDIAAAFSTASDTGDVEFVARRGEPASQYVSWNDREGRARCDTANERPPRDALPSHTISPYDFAFDFAGLNATAKMRKMANAPMAGTVQMPRQSCVPSGSRYASTTRPATTTAPMK